MVRYGNIHDLKDVMDMLNLCKLDMKERKLHIWDDNYPKEETIINDLKSGNSVVYDDNGKIVAFLVFYPNVKDKFEDSYTIHDNFILVQRVMSHPLYRRMGHAEAILRFVETLGYDAIRLLTRDVNIYSVNLYHKLGYHVSKAENKGNCVMQSCEKVLK